METVLGMCVFFITLFVYLHVYNHIKTSDDLEIFEISHPIKAKLEEICDLRQPTLFHLDDADFLSDLDIDTISKHYRSFDVKIRNIKKTSSNEEIYIPLSYHIARELLSKDTEGRFISENNSDFLGETGLIKAFQHNDTLFRPTLASQCMYDLAMGSANAYTPLRYNLNYRNFIYIVQGEAKVMLCPPKNSRYLHTEHDYENFEFRSLINPWSPQKVFGKDFEKVKFLELDIIKGNVLFIPAYWWYTIRFKADTVVAVLNYRTYMNNIAIAPEIGMSLLQNQNIKRDFIKKIEL